MGFAVLHIQKPKGNDAGTSTHIERMVNPGLMQTWNAST